MKVFLETVGCRLNQAEIESMARQFRAAGHEIVETAAQANLAVVNTCCVTAAAAADSRSAIRRAARAGSAEIVATGCWATLYARSAADMAHVSVVVPNRVKDRLVADVLRLPVEAINARAVERRALPGARRRTRAFIKVQDGCNNHCTFCVTTIARSEGRSRSMADVIAEVQAAVDGGAQEIVLTGVHLGSWGEELGMHLRDLIRAILSDTDVERVRLSSVEPWDLDEAFFGLWEDTRLCDHLHLPLQSGCASTLRRMARRTTPLSFRRLLAAAREVIPDAAITTDVIAGFPGETEQEFRASLDFVQEMNFAGGHAFTYSPMAGTPAARMSGQLPLDERRRRNRMYLNAFEKAAEVFRQGQVGKTRWVLWEQERQIDEAHWQLSGLTTNYLRVRASAGGPRWNQIDPVEIQQATDDGVLGIIDKTG